MRDMDAWMLYAAIEGRLRERARLRYPKPAFVDLGPWAAALLASLNKVDRIGHPGTAGTPPAMIGGIPVRIIDHLDGWLITDDPVPRVEP